MKLENREGVTIKKIGATLKHGRFLANNIYVACVGIIFSFSIVAIWLLLLQNSIQNRMLGYIVIFSLWALFFFWSLLTIIKTLKIKKEVLSWLEDAIEADAYVTQHTGANYNGLKIHFVYNNEKLSRASRCRHWRYVEGYDLFWEDYINKNIKIYYSPKYDEVMLFVAKVPTK